MRQVEKRQDETTRTAETGKTRLEEKSRDKNQIRTVDKRQDNMQRRELKIAKWKEKRQGETRREESKQYKMRGKETSKEENKKDEVRQ